MRALCEHPRRGPPVQGLPVSIGAENCHYEVPRRLHRRGVPEMLKELGVKYVIIGHSERRQYYNETDFTVNKKVHAALEAGLYPIVCVGESLEQRELGVTMDLISYQVKAALAGVPAEKMRHVVIAYEPLWAIGTGKTATAEQAGEVCGPSAPSSASCTAPVWPAPSPSSTAAP